MAVETGQSNILSRRNFIRVAGLGACGVGLAACGATPTAVPTVAAATWPWPYVELDPAKVAQMAYDRAMDGHNCSGGSFTSIIWALAEKVGAPYKDFPVEMLDFGGGGALAWGTLCGALTGSLAAVTLISKDFGAIGGELIGWYTQNAFPTWVPAEPKKSSLSPFPTSVSGSPLCHASITQWLHSAGFTTKSPEFPERCYRLTAETAAKAVELLNANMAGNLQPTFQKAASIETCYSCHGENTFGNQDCTSCHEVQQTNHP